MPDQPAGTAAVEADVDVHVVVDLTIQSPDPLLADSVLRDLEVVLGVAAGDPALLGPVRIPQPVPLEVWASRTQPAVR